MLINRILEDICNPNVLNFTFRQLFCFHKWITHTRKSTYSRDWMIDIPYEERKITVKILVCRRCKKLKKLEY